jgi:hypothetical protein
VVQARAGSELVVGRTLSRTMAPGCGAGAGVGMGVEVARDLMASGAVVAVQQRERDDALPRAAGWFWGAALAVVVWSASYLLRQPGVAAGALVEPFSFFGNFALEGMVLALAWLVLLASACLAVLTGVARIEDPS